MATGRGVTAGNLATRTGLTTGAITGAIDRLERAGLVERRTDDTDRRKVIVAEKSATWRAHPSSALMRRTVAGVLARYDEGQLAFLERALGELCEAAKAVIVSMGAEKRARGAQAILAPMRPSSHKGWRASIAALCLACGARSEIYAASSSGGNASGITADAAACRPPSPSGPCSSWSIRPAVVVSPSSMGSATAVGAAVRVGCAVMVAWTTTTLLNPDIGESQITWSTGLVAFDGSALAPPVAHPAENVSTVASTYTELAVNGSQVALVTDSTAGGSFQPMDRSGADRGSPVAIPACQGTSALGSGFSCTAATGADDTPVLAVFSAEGVSETRPLADASGTALWGRLVFPDGSFLLNTYTSENVWLEHFDPSGNALSSQVLLRPAEPAVFLGASAAGAVAGWFGVRFVAVDAAGQETGPVYTFPGIGLGEQPYVEGAMAGLPSGDVLAVVWEYATADGEGPLSTWVLSLAPDATPRGPAVRILSGSTSPHDVTIMVDDSLHALMLYDGPDGVQAMPLVCAGS